MYKKLFLVKLFGSYAFGFKIIRAENEEQAKVILERTSGHLLDEDNIFREIKITEFSIDGASGVIDEGYYIE